MMRHTWLIWPGLLAAILLLPASTPRPTIPPPIKPAEVQYTITGGSLEILSHPDYREFRYENGVTFSGEGIELNASQLVVYLDYGNLEGREVIKLPKPDPGELERDPSGAAAELAREIYMPSPELKPEMVKLIEASGGVSVQAGSIHLYAVSLISSDGGQTWRAQGRASVSAKNAEDGGSMQLSANELVYNITSQAGQAHGKIVSEFTIPGQPVVKLNAEQLSFDSLKQQLTASGQLRAASGELTMCCGTLTADISTQRITATDNPRLGHTGRGLTLTARELVYDMQQQVLIADGEVEARDELNQASLCAGQVVYDATNEHITASGAPKLRQGNSSYAGEVIRAWREESGKLVVEVEGQQTGRIDVSQLNLSVANAGS